MCITRMIFALLLITQFSVQAVSLNKGFSKLELASFAHSIIGAKINAKDFNIIIERVAGSSSAKGLTLDGAEVCDLIISSQQRDFEMGLKLKSGEQFSFSGKIEWLAHIPVLLRPIGTGEIINISDVGYQTYPVDQLNARVVMDANELVGKTASNAIVRPGLPVDKSTLKNPIVVKKGDVIDVVYRKPCLVISTKAHATQDFAVGDTGVFETQGDGQKKNTKKMSAKVVGPNIAEIVYGIA